MWGMIAASALGALSGAQKAKAEKKRAEEHDAYRKKAIEFSPWSGMGDPGAYQGGNQDVLSGALQGGAGGAMLGQGLGNAGVFGAEAAKKGVQAMGTNPAAPPVAPPMPMQTGVQPVSGFAPQQTPGYGQGMMNDPLYAANQFLKR